MNSGTICGRDPRTKTGITCIFFYFFFYTGVIFFTLKHHNPSTLIFMQLQIILHYQVWRMSTVNRNSLSGRHYVYVFQSECIGASDTGILHTKLFACNIHLVQFSYCGWLGYIEKRIRKIKRHEKNRKQSETWYLFSLSISGC